VGFLVLLLEYLIGIYWIQCVASTLVTSGVLYYYCLCNLLTCKNMGSF